MYLIKQIYRNYVCEETYPVSLLMYVRMTWIILKLSNFCATGFLPYVTRTRHNLIALTTGIP